MMSKYWMGLDNIVISIILIIGQIQERKIGKNISEFTKHFQSTFKLTVKKAIKVVNKI